MVSSILSCLLPLLNILILTAGENGCPNARVIAPCTCTTSPTVSLTCSNFVNNPDALLRVFSNARGYSFNEVYITNCVLPGIPSEIFQKVGIKELYLKNNVLQRAFSEMEVDNSDTNKLEIENTVVSRSLTLEDFTRFVNLKELRVDTSGIPTVSRRFSQSLPKNIKNIILSRTSTKSIERGALNNLRSLDKFSVQFGYLTTISRDVFPRPFNGRMLNFNNNKIRVIPGGLFTDMPNLQSLSMENNGISVIPEAAFTGRSQNLSKMRFEGNPIQCDCQLFWLIKNKPQVLGGTCAGPRKFAGRELQDLKPSEFRC